MAEKVRRSAEEWKAQLTPEQYRIAREHGTERAFTGEYWDEHAAGTYRCACCGAELFRSDEKYDSGSGWPSFTDPKNRENVSLITDTSHGMVRTEVTCAKCGGHLGHVFPDGPRPTGERYCMNGAALKFEEKT